MSSFYKLFPNKLGCIVRGIDLSTENRPEVIQKIKEDVTTHRILIFKDQGIVSGNRHVEISKWFGELESTCYKHPKSPHPDVFRVSNDESEGCTGVGRTGWHIDGSFQPAPFPYSLYHMVSVPKRGATAFAPLTELVESLPKETFSKWDRLWMMSDIRSGPVHPLIYKHPRSGKKVLCFHLGLTYTYIFDYGLPNDRDASPSEFKEISEEIHNEFWEPGDFIISDNLAVAHIATPETQIPRSEVGLRVLHRTTIKGTVRPSK
ncbi:hypothetical protein LSTR_LSTR006137 [Laodelphax striatellus]|uniref:TauD/TfdA-like domain-containing protein n=1 Tax=Laodelphax striatellus TaxID=195883 RepID=A0A482WYX8_LAOST|nr:hypothetical protein LSTR_LSTR006137 [Laodelphax striatellus]